MGVGLLWHSCWLGVVGALLSGCSVRPEPHGHTELVCDKTARSVSTDEQTPIGKPGAVAASLQEEYHVGLSWWNSGSGESSNTEAMLQALPDPTQARLVEEQETVGLYDECDGKWLEFARMLKLSTQDGAFADTFQGTISTSEPPRLRFVGTLPVADHQGSYETPPPEYAVRRRYEVHTSLGPDPQGHLTLEGEDPDKGDSIIPVSGAVAEWPAASSE